MDPEIHPEYVRCAHGGCNMVAKREVGACEMHVKPGPLTGHCIECSAELPPAYALTTCEKCQSAFARIRAYAEANGTNAPPAQPLQPERPIVRHGDVVPMVLNELTSLFRDLIALKQFEARVTEAAKSPAAWLQLRQELAK